MVGDPDQRDVLALIDGAIRVVIDLRAYRMSAVKKAGYRLARLFTLSLGSPRGHSLPVTFFFEPSVEQPRAMESVRLYYKELLDQELREEIGEETHAIRSLILAQAFSRTNLVRRD